MPATHMVSESEKKENCLYCGTAIPADNWTTIHMMEKHYKLNNCSDCGKEIKITVGWEGSGHDSWGTPYEKNIRKKKDGKIERVIGPLEQAVLDFKY